MAWALRLSPLPPMLRLSLDLMRRFLTGARPAAHSIGAAVLRFGATRFWNRLRGQVKEQTGTWCSGITSASHAEGPGFKSQCVHFRCSLPPIPDRCMSLCPNGYSISRVCLHLRRACSQISSFRCEGRRPVPRHRHFASSRSAACREAGDMSPRPS